MATKGQALRPDWFISNMPSLVKEKKVKEGGATDEEKHIYALSNHAGWKVIREKIENAINDMDGLNKAAMEGGANYETLGQNTVVITLAKDIIKRAILDPIEDATDACENPDGTAK